MRTRQQSADRLAARNRAQAAVNAEASRVAYELERRDMLRRHGKPSQWVLWLGMGVEGVSLGSQLVPPVRQAKRLYDLVLDLLGAREDRERLKAENEAVRAVNARLRADRDAMEAAILPLVENCEHWIETGEAATAEDSRAMYLALCQSIGREPRV